MKESELKERIDKIKSNLKPFDMIINFDWGTNGEKCYVNERQADAVQELLDLFKSLKWQLALNSYKGINYTKRKTLEDGLTASCGDAVKVSPCSEKYGGKTYFGVYIGDIALSVGCNISQDGTLNVGCSMHNPAILVPELGEVIYGAASWWGVIESEDDLKELITEETISNVWYVKMLESLTSK